MNDRPVLNLIAISYAKRALLAGSRERARMQAYAAAIGQYHLVVFTRQRDGFPAVQQEGNLFLYATNARTRVGMLWRAWRIGRMILQDHPADPWVVSSQDPFEAAVVARAVASGNRARNHVQLHGDSFNPLAAKASLLQRLRTLYGKYVVRHTSCIRVVSDRLKRSLVQLGASSRITVLPIQADLESFLAVGAVRKYHAATPKFLYVGRFSSEKNLLLLLTAFAEIAATNDEVTLTLLGDGPERARLEGLVARLRLTKQVTFALWTDDVSSLMATHDVLCLASDHEGWGMVLLEAAAAGMPIVTTDVGCAGEIIIHNENGQVVPVRDQAAYACALKVYLEQPELVKEHGRRAHEVAQAQVLPVDMYFERLVDSYTSCARP